MRFIIPCFLLLTSHAFAQQSLIEIPGCIYIKEEWADGDSFRIRTPEGKERTVRLYGIDCIETIIRDESDVSRLRSQRRYFGIESFGGDVSASIKLAMEFGREAAETTERLLKKPFTIHTSYADARGDARFERIYGFVVTSEGKDLAAELVSKGLARAFGVSRSTLDGRSRDDYMEELQDIELQAALKAQGVWAKTDWERLPNERSVQRIEERESGIAMGNSKLKEGETVRINDASRDELMRLPGIGETRANGIIEGRPFHKAEDLLKVKNIAETILKDIEPYLDLSQP